MRGKIKELLGHILLTLFVSLAFAGVLTAVILIVCAVLSAIYRVITGA